MLFDWSTEEQDMRFAGKVIEHYTDLNDGEPPLPVEMVVTSGQSVQFRSAPWIDELANTFRQRYGDETGEQITLRVVTRYLIRNQSIH